jgi:hypothetical protein
VTTYFAWLQNSQASAWVRAESPWLWPLCETLHFIGLALLLGIAGLMDFRLMGFLRSIPLRAIAGFRNWAVGAFGLNLATGLVFFTGSTNQYVVNPYWWAKVGFLMLAGANAVAFEAIIRRGSPDAFTTGDTPTVYKCIGALSLIAWLGVLVCGRLLPFVGGTD